MVGQPAAALARGPSKASPLEREADRHAGARAGRTARDRTGLAPLSPARRSDPAAQPLESAADLGLANGRGLTPAEARLLPVPLVGELDRIRIHAGGAAGQLARTMGARALAVGEHVVLGDAAQDTAEDRGATMAHELAHVAQQQMGGVEVVQRQDEPRRDGIGRRPPDEPVVFMEGSGAEDKHALFVQDSIEVPEGFVAQIVELVSQAQGPVEVDIHGYASLEGDEEYNRNLSAHRAVAVRRALEPLLPAGTVVHVYAYGRTAEFGALANNRRVGVDVGPPLALTLPSFGLGGVGWQRPVLGGGLSEPGTAGPPGAGVLTPPVGPFGPTPPPLRPELTHPSLALPPFSIGRGPDWAGPALQFGLRGERLAPGDVEGAERFWREQFRLYGGLGPGVARALADMALENAAAARAARDNPSRVDQLEQERSQQGGTTVGPASVDLLKVPDYWRKLKKAF